jgi:tRNA A37 methylthiotransferase MiaB
MANAVPSHVANARAKALRQLIAVKNESFRRSMIGRQLDVLVLQPADALSSNFIRVRVPSNIPINTWARVQATDLDDAGLVASETLF